jgi:hypothetical protein
MRLLLFSTLLFSCQSTEKLVDSGSITETLIDVDGDGFTEDQDCDDDDEAINPAATELCDGIDNNCDGFIDEDVLLAYYADSDEDGFGNPDITTEACEVPSGFVENGSDCDDTDSTSFPGGEEICDGNDNNCDDEIDEGLSETYFVDEDGDGFGNPDLSVEACLVATGLSPLGDDCDDADLNINPLATEICDEIDNNCDGTADEGVTISFYQDSDGDGFGTSENFVEACEVPEGYTERDGDCDDLETYANPFSIEICDEIDNDCDGLIDEIGASGELTFYTDADGDGFGDSATVVTSCTVPVGAVLQGGDCDDNEVTANPSAVEICDEIDNDCDGTTDETGAAGDYTFYTDGDGDGYGDENTELQGCLVPSGSVLVAGDCDDTTTLMSPGAFEICDGLDNDCDSLIDNNAVNELSWYLDNDEDGYGDANSIVVACDAPTGYTGNDEDCDDTELAINPAASEICDDIDNNCDNVTDLNAIDRVDWYDDADEDGFGDLAVTVASCEAPTGFIDNADDCLDSDSAINPLATEICDDQDNDCDGNIDNNASDAITMYYDADLDGFGDPETSETACEVIIGYTENNEDCNDLDDSINPDA